MNRKILESLILDLVLIFALCLILASASAQAPSGSGESQSPAPSPSPAAGGSSPAAIPEQSPQAGEPEVPGPSPTSEYVEPPVLPGLELGPLPPPPLGYQLPASVTGLGPVPVIDPESRTFPVRKFHIAYAATNPKQPSIQNVAQANVVLGKNDKTVVGRESSADKVTINLAQQQNIRTFSGGALLDICKSLTEAMNKQNIHGVFAAIDPNDINTNFEDLRKGKTDLTIRIYTFEVKEIRTVNKNPHLKPNENVINNPRFARISAHSPITTSSKQRAGNLLAKDQLENYLGRVNRFPGRRVDAAVSSTGKPGELILDYLVREDKPYFGYFQISNTGTDTTNAWQERFGLDLRQLARLDDILHLEYVTSGFSESNSFLGSYEVAALFPDVLKVRAFGSYGNFTAADVGFDLQRFSGTTWNTGAVVTWTPFIWQGFAFDFFAGATWQNVLVDNRTFGSEGQTDFFMPVLGMAVGKTVDRYSLGGTLTVEANAPDIAGTDSDELQKLGRFQTDRDFTIMKWNFRASAFLEPLFLGKKAPGAASIDPSKLAHELNLAFRGQYTFGGHRLVPQFEEVVGGFNSVRGYPESIAAGDSVMIASGEYRYHLMQPAIARAPEDDSDAKRKGLFGLPPTVAKRPWDLNVHTFLDFGQTYNNRILSSTEVNRTLLGTGVGVELAILRDPTPDLTGLRSIMRDITLTLRLDWGFALDPIDRLTINRVEVGDSRLHFAGTITF